MLNEMIGQEYNTISNQHFSLIETSETFKAPPQVPSYLIG